MIYYSINRIVSYSTNKYHKGLSRSVTVPAKQGRVQVPSGPQNPLFFKGFFVLMLFVIY
jgi:hypothetical protein